MNPEYEQLSDAERNAILEEKGTLLSDDEWKEIERRWESPTGQMIGVFGSRMPRINKRADNKGLCKLRKVPKSSLEKSIWDGKDSRLACIVDGIIEKHRMDGDRDK